MTLWTLAGLLLALVAVLALAGAWTELTTRGKRNGAHVLAWRWLSGGELDGKMRTNASWFHPATKTLHPSGHAVFWHHWPRTRRAAVRAGTTLGVPFLAVAVLEAPRVMTALAAGLLTAVVIAATWLTGRRLAEFREHPWHKRPWELVTHRRRYVRPLHGALTPVLGAPPARLRVSGDRSRVVLALPAAFTGAPKDKEEVTRAIAAKLALEAPDADWGSLHGRRPEVVFTRSQPPPETVTWDDIQRSVERARPEELITGIGKRSQVVKGSLKTDSPHLLVSMGTGAGKSNLTAFWLLQRLRRGAIALILDAKYFSHPWAFKDIDAEYGQLPNVAYARRDEDLHDAMVWLGEEVRRRTDVAERAINSEGDILADVGPELIVVAEELNLAADRLRQYWADIREKEDPKKSPAFTGFSAVAYAGRAIKMHIIAVGQMLTADVMGGGAVRENMGIRCLSRYTKNAWKMQAGDLAMPPSPTETGRVQCVMGSSVSEAQVPYVEKCVRDLVLAGTVTPCPAGMPGIVREHVLALVSGPGHDGLRTGPDLPKVPGHQDGMTLTEARSRGILQLSEAAARKAAQRPGFPAPVLRGGPGVASRWKPSELHAWQKSRDLARRPL